MDDLKLWWAIGVVAAGFIAKTAVDWWRTDDIDRRLREIEKWRIRELEKWREGSYDSEDS